MVRIVQREDPILREIAKEVPIGDITSSRIKQILKDMKTALNAEEDGVAIAAPQIGVPLRIFMLSEKAFEVDEKMKGKGSGDQDKKKQKLIYINPKITKLSKEKSSMEEGCLSVRWAYGDTKRSIKSSIEAYDEDGNKFQRGGSGLISQIFQHETDHLDGVLFIDKAKNVREIPPEDLDNQ